MKSPVSSRSCIILDACCVINLYATGRIHQILGSISETVAVAHYVKEKEILSVYDGPRGNERSVKKVIELDPLITDGSLIVISPSLEELNTYVNLAFEIDDGEAYTGAIAIHREWALATDDKKTIHVINKILPEVPILSTLELVKHWTEITNAPPEIVSELLQDIKKKAIYEPHRSHQLYDWWKSYMDLRLDSV